MRLDPEVYTRLGNVISRINERESSGSGGCGCGGDIYIDLEIDGTSLGSWAVSKDELEGQKRVVRAAAGPAATRAAPTSTVGSTITVQRQNTRVGCG